MKNQNTDFAALDKALTTKSTVGTVARILSGDPQPTGFQLGENAILMRLSISIPGEERQDPDLSADVKSEHKLGSQAGKWVKKLYPPEALAKIKQVDNKARAFHAAVTLPYDQGTGILPGKLVLEYGDKMRHFKGQRENLIENDFLADPEKWIKWAMKEHNGTFDFSMYPGLYVLGKDATPDNVTAVLMGQNYVFKPDEFRQVMREKFSFEAVPLPVPNSNHFTDTMQSLLGVDAASVDMRVKDAAEEAQRELMHRLIAPVKAMAQKLGEKPKVRPNGKQAEDIIFRDTLIENVKEIAELGPKLNLTDDPAINKFCQEMAALAKYEPAKLREDKTVRAQARADAEALMQRLAGYSL